MHSQHSNAEKLDIIIVTVLENLYDGARDFQMISEALPQRDNLQIDSTVGRRHIVVFGKLD